MKSRMLLFLPAIISFLFFHCKPKEKEENEFVRGMKTVYLSEFKLTYFHKLLRAAFNHSDKLDSVFLLDHSHFTEPLLTDSDERLIDSLVDLDNRWMMSDSASSIGRVAEGGEGKHVFKYIICTMEGKDIEELALRRYEIWEAEEIKIMSAY